MGSPLLYERATASDPILPEALTDRLCALLPAEGVDTAVLVVEVSESDLPLLSRLEAVRHRLPEKGILLAATPAAGLRELTIGLSESGFVILKEEAIEADGRWSLLRTRKEPFFIRPYREGDEEQILPMFRRSFYVDRGVARWAWEYRENPYGTLKISEAFSEDGRLVAHYAGYPVRFHREAGGEVRTFPALQIGDTMTEPSIRSVGRGPTSLLGRTVRHYYARNCEGQVAFNYGFNTGNIQRFSMSFVGARRLESLPFHVRDAQAPVPVPPAWLTRLRGYRVERISHFDARWDELFRRVSGAYELLIERDARYLEWRYARCPDTEYSLWAIFRRKRLVGWSVFRPKGDQGERLAWGDALFDPRHPEAIPLLLAHILAAPEHRSARTVELWLTSRPSWWSERVRALGFEPRPEPDDLGYVFVPFGMDPEEDFRARLYYMMGDSDLF